MIWNLIPVIFSHIIVMLMIMGIGDSNVVGIFALKSLMLGFEPDCYTKRIGNRGKESGWGKRSGSKLIKGKNYCVYDDINMYFLACK